MNWYEIGASRVSYSWGDGHTYLVAALEHEVRLSRFRSPSASPMSMAVEAVRNAIVFPMGRGPGRPGGAPELAALTEAAKSYAERYESGESLDGHLYWQRERPSGPLYLQPGEFKEDHFTVAGGNPVDDGPSTARFLATGDARDCPHC